MAPKARGQRKGENSHSVSDKAAHFHLAHSKVTRMRITMGCILTPPSLGSPGNEKPGQACKGEVWGTRLVCLGDILNPAIWGCDPRIRATSGHAKGMRAYRSCERSQKERKIQEERTEQEYG